MSLKGLPVLVLVLLMMGSGIVCAAHDDRNPHRVGGRSGASGYIAGTWDYDPTRSMAQS